MKGIFLSVRVTRGDLTPASAGEELSNESRCDTSAGNPLHSTPMLG